MMASAVMYVVVGVLYVTTVSQHPIVLLDRLTVFALLGIVALAMASASVWWRRRALETTASGSLTFATFQTALIVCWAMSEVSAIVGVVATLLTSDVSFVVVGAVVTLVLIGLVHRPDFETLEEATRAASVHGR